MKHPKFHHKDLAEGIQPDRLLLCTYTYFSSIFLFQDFIQKFIENSKNAVTEGEKILKEYPKIDFLFIYLKNAPLPFLDKQQEGRRWKGGKRAEEVGGKGGGRRENSIENESDA